MQKVAKNHGLNVMTKLLVAILMAFFIVPVVAFAKSSGSQSMFRLYNPYSGEHFYTASGDERTDLVKAGWRYEGIGWTAPARSGTPVYRLYNPYAGDHHYTTSAQERDALKRARWRDEGIGWYSDDEKKLPVYRQYNPYARVGTHNFTPAKQEHDNLVRVGWRGEGVAWYALSGRVSESVVGTYKGTATKFNTGCGYFYLSSRKNTCFGARNREATLVITDYDSKTGYISGRITALCHGHSILDATRDATAGDQMVTRDFVGECLSLKVWSWNDPISKIDYHIKGKKGALGMGLLLTLPKESPGTVDVEVVSAWYPSDTSIASYSDLFTFTKVSDAR